MGKTLIQKILERTLQRDVTVGEIIELPVDLAWGSEMTLKFAIDALEHHGLLNGSYDKQILSHSDKIMFPLAFASSKLATTVEYNIAFSKSVAFSTLVVSESVQTLTPAHTVLYVLWERELVRQTSHL
jgi:homoaconitase/3-isopropylmalate dehydratase large subunit